VDKKHAIVATTTVVLSKVYQYIPSYNWSSFYRGDFEFETKL